MATIKEYKIAIKGTRGIYIKIAENLRITRQAVNDMMNRHPQLKEIAQQEKEQAIDCAEDTIYAMATMNTLDPKKMPLKLKAAERIVKTQGKNRGWIETKQLEHSGEINNTSAKEIYDEIKRERANNKKSNSN